MVENDKNLSNTEYIEPDKNPFPKMDIVPGLGWVRWLGDKIINICYFLPTEAPDYMSEHFKGGGPALDDALYDTEHAVGHMVVVGEISAQEGSDWLERIDWIEKATLHPRHLDGKP